MGKKDFYSDWKKLIKEGFDATNIDWSVMNPSSIVKSDVFKQFKEMLLKIDPRVASSIIEQLSQEIENNMNEMNQQQTKWGGGGVK